MLHRHLNHQGFSLAAIDNIIERGQRDDWASLRQAALGDKEIVARIMRVCGAHADDPYAQRYQFWKAYVERRLA